MTIQLHAPTSEAGSVGTSSQATAIAPGEDRFGWLAVLLAAWIVAGLYTAAFAFSSGGISDSVVSVYHVPLYLGVLALAGTCLWRAVRARRAGLNWRTAFPAGYELLVAGAIALLAWPIVELGWREGVGINGEAAQVFAPSRILLIGGCLLVAVAPLRASGRPTGRAASWRRALAAALVFTLAGIFGIEPAQNAWLQAPPLDPGARSEIWVMNSDGSAQTRLIVPPAGYQAGTPAWSPDGTQIAYTISPVPEYSGQQPADVQIWLASADGSGQHQLIAGSGWYWLPHWSADGQWITFTLDAQYGPGSGAGVLPPAGAYNQPPPLGQPQSVSQSVDVWRVRANGIGPAEQLSSDPAEDRAAVYSPDGRHLLFDSTRAEGRTGLYVAEADGSKPQRITMLGDDWAGSWSPDGTRIAFNASRNGAAYDIYLTDYPPVSAPQQLTNDPANDSGPSWAPDGSRIVFSSTRTGQNDVWSMAADGSDLINLTATHGVAETLTSGGQSWGPDGRIVYVRQQDAPAFASDLVRNDLGIISMLLGALILALLVLVTVGGGAPFGAVTLMLALGTAVAAVGSGETRFVPAALVGGLIVDFAIRLAGDRRRQLIGAVGAALAFVLAPGLTVMATGVLGWSPALLLGVALAAAVLAGGVALLVGPFIGARAAAAGE
jgi:Tol biopolymer transport system component